MSYLAPDAFPDHDSYFWLTFGCLEELMAKPVSSPASSHTAVWMLSNHDDNLMKHYLFDRPTLYQMQLTITNPQVLFLCFSLKKCSICGWFYYMLVGTNYYYQSHGTLWIGNLTLHTHPQWLLIMAMAMINTSKRWARVFHRDLNIAFNEIINYNMKIS